MNRLRYLKVASLVVVIAASLGCKSKQEQPAANGGAEQGKAAPPAATAPQDKAAAPVIPPKDKQDAQAAAAHVLALMQTGDFAGIYRDASAGFKQIGSEGQFVGKFQQTRQNVGVLEKPREIGVSSLPGKGYIFTYRLENERYNSDVRLTFARSPNGKMELAGLNQHDELKK